MLSRRGLVLVTVGLLGCDQRVGDEAAQGLREGVLSGDAGWILVSRDSGVDLAKRDAGGLTTVTPPKDAGPVPGDAGQDAGPVAVVTEDAGLVLDKDGGSVEPNPTIDNPACKTIFYRDADNDGFGDPKVSVISCTQPAGYVLAAGDCYDANERARPGATGQFLSQRGDGSFDYDCDGVETLARTKFAICPKVQGACPPDALLCNDAAIRLGWDAAEDGGWTDFRIVPCVGSLCPSDKSKVPACGQAGYWGLSVAWDLLGARYGCTIPVAGTTRIQTCR